MAAVWSASIGFVTWVTCSKQQGAVEIRVQGTWEQFQEYAQWLNRRRIPLRQKGRVYKTCAQSVMVYASETCKGREGTEDGEK